MSAERIDVRALIKQAADVLDEEYFQMAAVEAAVAEMIEADEEYAEAVSRIEFLLVVGGSAEEAESWMRILDLAKLRRAAALVRVQGGVA